jgi:formamidopyrimidine-DNA glycosylase
MPELPDLHVFSQNLLKKLRGKKLEKLVLVNKSKLKSPAAKVKKAVEGQVVKKIYREGKEIHFLFANGQILGLHMMLRGMLHFFEGKNENKYNIAEMYFNNGMGLALTDYQRNANLTLNPMVKESPDALSKKVNPKLLKEILSRKAAVKNVLLDQDVIRGIGNAYADEILWSARISPFSISEKIPAPTVAKLAKEIKSVLNSAIRQIAKKEPGIIGGEVRDFLKIHNSKREESPSGAKIKVRPGSRKTYYTDEQKLYK